MKATAVTVATLAVAALVIAGLIAGCGTSEQAANNTQMLEQWVTIASWEGSNSKRTERFTVDDEWRIKWSTELIESGPSTFAILAEPVDGQGKSEICTYIHGPGEDITYPAAGGTYQLDIKTVAQTYIIEVQQKQ